MSSCNAVKTCKKCGCVEFYSTGRCKSCARESVKRYEARNSEKIKAYRADWAEKNPKKVKARQEKYKAEKRETYLENRKKRYAANVEKSRKYYLENASRIAVIGRAWSQKNKDKCRTYLQNRRAKIRLDGNKLSPNLVEKLMTSQRGKCAVCRRVLGDDYHLDHIIPIFLGGSNSDGNIQLLHSRCNKQKYAKDPIMFMQSRGFLI